MTALVSFFFLAIANIEATMWLILIGAVLVIGGFLYLFRQALSRRLSEPHELMGSSNRMAFCKRFFNICFFRDYGEFRNANSKSPSLWSSDASRERLPEAGSSSRSTDGRRMMGLRRVGCSNVDDAIRYLQRLHPNTRNHPAYVPAGTF
jgi:hypothetical protein